MNNNKQTKKTKSKIIELWRLYMNGLTPVFID